MTAASASSIWRLRLLDRPRREAQIDRAAGIALHVLEAPAHQHGELVDEGRLEARHAGLRQADQRLARRLMRAALGREGQAGRRRHQHEAGILVAGVIQRIEAALDEGIVERADRQQPRAEERTAEAERGELEEKIVLGDAELDVLALRREQPALRRDDLLVAEHVLPLGAVEEAAAIDPAAEIGRHGDVGRGRDDAAGELAARRRRDR